MTPKTIPQHFSSKDAIFKLSNGDNYSWWFMYEDDYFVINYLRCGYPELEAGYFFDSKEEALDRLKDMTDSEDWKFVNGEEEFLEAYGDAFEEKDGRELERLQHRTEER